MRPHRPLALGFCLVAALLSAACVKSRTESAERTEGDPAPLATASERPREDWQAVADLPDCPPSKCTGPRMGMPNWMCPDGRTGGPVCKRGPDGACGWTVVRCPEADPEPVFSATPTATVRATSTPRPRPSPSATKPPSAGPARTSAADAVAEACAKPCKAGQTRRGILRCVADDGRITGVAGAINCPSFSLPRDERRPRPPCAAFVAESGCAAKDQCLAMDGTCCRDDFGLVIPTGSLGNMYCGSPGQRCSRCKCLPSDATIATPDGDRPIAEIGLGDRVWTEAADGRRVGTVVEEVARVPAPPDHRMLEVSLEDGRVVRASPTHPAADGRPLEAFTPGTWLDGSRVAASRLLSTPVPETFDVLPAGETGVYWVNGVRLRSTIPTGAHTEPHRRPEAAERRPDE